MKSLTRSKGFSLIEMLIAVIILSVSLLGLAGLMVGTTKNNSLGNHLTEAAIYAQERLEALRTSSWANIVSGSDLVQGSTGINYNRNWTVSVLPNPAPPPADLEKTISITVSWDDGINHSIKFLSVIPMR